MFSSSSLPRIPHRMFYSPVYLKLTLSSAHCEFFACMYVFFCIPVNSWLRVCLFLYLVLCICVYRSCSCFLFWRFQPVSGFLFLPSKSGPCIFIFLCLFVFSVLSLCSLSQYQSCLVYYVWLLCFCIIVVRTFWFWPYFRVLADYSPAFSLCTSEYLIIWNLTSACWLSLCLALLNLFSLYIVRLGPLSLSPPSQYITPLH